MLYELIHSCPDLLIKEYGYEEAHILWEYLTELSENCENGMMQYNFHDIRASYNVYDLNSPSDVVELEDNMQIDISELYRVDHYVIHEQ